ncbi:MAG: YkgJ family cysteine cluster protein [Proteobacteria bacterium]|nr:YkgJ family cysteine cluster protein [Pseudomonadota bacterium]MBU4470877.1 YkgJ family cysteine cluster protein [Pseudomonadota bacterium]MCG2751875.1 YkgJ family cysteine cluster protein [Desulfobacteraceae bacterium]
MTALESQPLGHGTPLDHPLHRRPYFFDGGVQFQCLQCGRCCTGDPGLVRVSEKEISAIYGFLNMGLEEFTSRFLRVCFGGYSLGEDEEGRCLFHEGGCRVYEVRPRQCQAFPFWVKTFRSEKNFRDLQKECPGIGQGRLYSKEEILAILFVE